jgi:preprotein translocase subunit SecE
MARQGMDPAGTRAPGGNRGAKDGGRTTSRRSPAQQTATERVGPRQYLSEVRAEMRKVAWPTRAEIINSSLIVLVAVTVMTLLIFGFDYFSAKFVLFLFD